MNYETQPNPEFLMWMAQDSEKAELRADIATVIVFLRDVASDPKWESRAKAILHILGARP